MSKPVFILPVSNTFLYLNRDTVAIIQNRAALGIWVYALAQGEHWRMNEDEIRDVFEIGQHRYRMAVEYLDSLGLLTRTLLRYDNGRLAGRALYANRVPNEPPAGLFDRGAA